MISESALVIYKGKPAIVKDQADGKYTISLQNNEQVKVREKDIELIHPGPVKDFNQINYSTNDTAAREAWELLTDEDTALSLKDLATLVFNEYTPASAIASYSLLKEGLYFSGTISGVIPRLRAEVAEEETKRGDKLRETTERSQFLEQVKICLKKTSGSTSLPDFTNPVFTRFFQDVEALAYGKSLKSRTMKDLGLGETPEDAHSLLLKTGFWKNTVNPHPSRFGLSLYSADICPPEPEHEERHDLCHLAAFAIDSPWSNDPDDAVSIESDSSGNNVLYVHIADPASSITFDSPAEKEARDRGATLYIPEGAIRMISEKSFIMFALGLSEKSIALTFKMIIDKNGNILDTEIFPSIVKIRRITYKEADEEMEKTDSQDSKMLNELYNLAQKILKRRILNGAMNIELPDVHITAVNGKVNINPVISYRSNLIIRECMIAAGEGAGTWAIQRNLCFPYIKQEVEIQGLIQNGIYGSWQLRRCMRPRILSTKPGCHQGLGLDTYSQVTSPLRRYTDLLAHIQIRTFLRGGVPLNTDEVSARLGFSEAGASAVVQAERASNNHWIMVYLSDLKDSVWEAVTLENKGNRMQVIIPSLALETQVSLQKDHLPNEKINIILKSANIPRAEAVFVH